MIAGVGGVVVFLPNILLLFLAIALLEDTGYMARAAFVMDRLMHKIGLHGKSFIPMLIGFGCSVPAIMATRILENRRNRLTTILVIPLMSCGARLTIYSLLIPAFFAPHWRGPVMWSIYLIGIVLAVVCAKLLRLTIFQGETMPFVMELPPYRVPTPRSVLIHMWQRGWMFLKKAGTVILGISIVLWVLASFPKPSARDVAGLDEAQVRQVALAHSAMGRVGHFIEPALKPLGFDWKIGTALIGSLAAKEVFVSQLSIVYAVHSQDSRDVLQCKAPGQLYALGRVLHPALLSDLGALRGDPGRHPAGDRLLALGRLSIPRPDGSGLWRDFHRVSDWVGYGHETASTARRRACKASCSDRDGGDCRGRVRRSPGGSEDPGQLLPARRGIQPGGWRHPAHPGLPVHGRGTIGPTRSPRNGPCRRRSTSFPTRSRICGSMTRSRGQVSGMFFSTTATRRCCKGPVAFSPRVSLVAPTGDHEEGLGSGAWGVQGNLPLSLELGERWVTHWNLGATYFPGAKGPDGSQADLTGINYGASVIYFVNDHFNLMTGGRRRRQRSGRRRQDASSGSIRSSSTPGCVTPSTSTPGSRSFPA